ncbi:MAG: GMC oxidoreductase [Myxococcota bacterium]
MPESFDVVLVGAGFASTFFAYRWLQRNPRTRVLMLERGPDKSHQQQIDDGDPLFETPNTIRNLTPSKPWMFKHLVGGSSNCWTGNTPRMTPGDFQLRTRYGVGVDWPLTYDDIEPYYCEAESLLGVAGSQTSSPVPMSRPYPLPPHRMADPDLALARAHPGQFFPMPCARPTKSIGLRPACCASIRCVRCPVDSKFTILNGMRAVLDHPQVTVRPDSLVQHVDVEAGRATGVTYRSESKQAPTSVRSEHLVVLGANAIFNAHLLLRTGLDEGQPGRGLVEQTSVNAIIKLNGMKAFQGSTQVTTAGYPWYDGPHRRRHAAALLECNNEPRLRDLPGRWREQFMMRVVVEDLPNPESRVTLEPDEPDRPRVRFAGISPYAQAGIDAAKAGLPGLLSSLPVEQIKFSHSETEAHIQCTTPMGTDPKRSVVDADSIHHRVRNLLILGASTFPTAAPANPTLTLSALALRAADRLSA